MKADGLYTAASMCAIDYTRLPLMATEEGKRPHIWDLLMELNEGTVQRNHNARVMRVQRSRRGTK